MNPILESIYEARKGHYVHALEVESRYELQSAVEQLYSEFCDEYTIEDIKDFFNTLQIYALDDDQAEEVYSFVFDDFIDTLI